MAVTFHDFGGTIPITLAGTVAAGDICELEDIAGFYLKSGVSGEVAAMTIGIQSKLAKGVTKESSEAFALGERVFWGNTAAAATNTVTSTMAWSMIGYAYAARSSGTTTVDVILAPGWSDVESA